MARALIRDPLIVMRRTSRLTRQDSRITREVRISASAKAAWLPASSEMLATRAMRV